MSNKGHVPPLEFAPEVTNGHGVIFAKLFLAAVVKTEIPGEAFNATGVMECPAGEDDETPVDWRYERIEDEIMRRVLAEIEEPLRDAFTTIAREVIERERRRQANEAGE